MANTFIIWDDKELARGVREKLSEKYPDDRFIIGGETDKDFAITSNILAEMDASDFAVCLISKVPLSVNVFYELGYMTARLRESYRVLVCLVDQQRASLPFDVYTNPSFTVETRPDPRALYDRVCEKYGRSKERQTKEDGQKYIAIFNNWPAAKRRLSELRSGILNVESVRDHLIHSIIPAYFYGKKEQEDLLSLCRDLPNPDGTLTAVKDLVFLTAEHYHIGGDAWGIYPLEVPEEENIWLRFYAALYNGLQAVTLVERKLTAEENYRSAPDRSVQYLMQAETLLNEIQMKYFRECKTPNFYMSLLEGFLWNNFAAAYGARKRLLHEDVDVQACLRRSIEFRKEACKGYNALARVEKSDVIMEGLEKEYLWGLLKEIKYLEGAEGVSCGDKREYFEKQKERIKNRNLFQDFWDEQGGR